MDSEHWISRLAAAKRFYAAQLGHVDGEAARPFLLLVFFPRFMRVILLLICGVVVGLGADMPGMGMEEMEMGLENDGDMEMEMALELGEATWPEVACPYCYEDHDVASLCVHLEEDHPYEPHAAVSQLAVSPCPAEPLT